MRPMSAPISGIFSGKFPVAGNQHVFGVPLLGRVRVVVASRDNDRNIYNNKFIVLDGVGVVVALLDAMSPELLPLAAARGELPGVEQYAHIHAASAGRNKGIRDGARSERVGGHTDRILRDGEDVD